MIGMLFQALGQVIQSNPALVGHAVGLAAKESGVSDKVNKMITGPSKKEILARQKKEAAAKKAEEAARMAKELAEIQKHDEEMYTLAINLEKERLIETNERAKSFDEDILFEFASKRLVDQLPTRIEEYSRAQETLEAEISKIDKECEALYRQKDDLAFQERERKKQESKFNAERKRVRKLNSMYETYVTSCGPDGIPDDIGMLTIMTATKKLGVSEEELEEIKRFASKHRFSSAAEYLKEPEPPVVSQTKTGTEAKKIAKVIRQLSEERKSKAAQCQLYGELVAVLEKRMPNSDTLAIEEQCRDEQADDVQGEMGTVECEEECIRSEESDQDMETPVSAMEVIFEAFEHCRGVEGLEELYIGQDIPEDKLDNAAESMNLKESEVAILWDTTVWGSAKDGMLVTEKAVYFKNLWESPRRFTWNRILKLKNDGDGDFSFGHYTFNTNDEDAANEVYDSLIEVAQRICQRG